MPYNKTKFDFNTILWQNGENNSMASSVGLLLAKNTWGVL